MKGMTTHFSHGFGTIFTGWQLYAMVATGGLGMFLVQSALNAGRLIAAQPGLTLSDPIISILWGVLAFHERVRAGMVPAAVGRAEHGADGRGRVRAGPLPAAVRRQPAPGLVPGRAAGSRPGLARGLRLTPDRREPAGACDGG